MKIAFSVVILLFEISVIFRLKSEKVINWKDTFSDKTIGRGRYVRLLLTKNFQK